MLVPFGFQRPGSFLGLVDGTKWGKTTCSVTSESATSQTGIRNHAGYCKGSPQQVLPIDAHY